MNWNSCVEGSFNIPTISCIFVLFENVINFALGLAGVVALIFIIVAGIKLITSGGDSKKVASARSTLTFAIIGLLLVFFSFGIVFFISTLTGTSCIRLFGFGNCRRSGLDTPPPAPKYGCFYNADWKPLPHRCYQIGPNNDPPTPVKGPFSSYNACVNACPVGPINPDL